MTTAVLWLFVLGLQADLNPILTPGRTRPLSFEIICQTRWGTDRRYVTEAMKRHVAEAYRIPWEDRTCCEFDHLIPRSLGGADDILNLWPQPWPEAKLKDRLEVRLDRLVCAGTIPLREAQRSIAKDWKALYKRFVGPLPSGDQE